MRASLVSATSLLALLVAEGEPAFAAPILSDASSTIGSAYRVAGGGTSNPGVGSFLPAGASGSQTAVGMPATPYSPATPRPNASPSDTGPLAKAFTFGALTTGAASTAMTAAGSNASDMMGPNLSASGVAPAASAPGNRSFYLPVGMPAAANMVNGGLVPGGGSNHPGIIGPTSSVFTSTQKPGSFNDPSAGRLANAGATTSSTYTYTSAPRGGVIPAAVRTAPTNGTNASIQGGSFVPAPVSMLTVHNTGKSNPSEPGAAAAGTPPGSVTSLSTGRTVGTQSPTPVTPSASPVSIVAYTYSPAGRGTPTSAVTFNTVNGRSGAGHTAQEVSNVFTNQLVEAAATSGARGVSDGETPDPSASGPFSPASSGSSLGTLGYARSAKIYPAMKTISPDGSDSPTAEQFSIAATESGSFGRSASAAGSPSSQGSQVLLPLVATNTTSTGMLNSSLMIFSDASANLGGTAGTFTFSLTSGAIPEPATLALLGAGVAGLAGTRRRRR